MFKNIFAAIGLALVAKAVYEHYCEYQGLKKREESRRKSEIA
jgi:hypothetical protein